MSRSRIDITGLKKGRLTVRHRENGKWVCDCECGSRHTVTYANLLHGNTNSCGCLKKELLAKEKLTHGLTDSRLYSIWGSMKTRCTNSSRKCFSRYGGRGIEICKEWMEDFSAFNAWAVSNGYEDGLTIDRIDNDAGYSPENSRWVTHKVNCRNRSNNIVGTIGGLTKCLTEFCEEYGVSYSMAVLRIRNGWDFEKAVTTSPISSSENKRARFVVIYGEKINFSHAAKKYGIRRTAVLGRINRGWDIEKAFKTPVGQKQ